MLWLKCCLILVCTCLIACQSYEIGSLHDTRDQQTYATLKISQKEWMTENLRFQTDTSWCYQNDIDNCRKYGRLYAWSQAMKACPEGWRLPTQAEWQALSEQVFGGEWWKTEGGETQLYHQLSSDGSSGMNLDLPGLYSPQYDAFKGLGEIGSFWTSTPFAFEAAVCAVIDKKNGAVFMINPGSKEVGHSCRCVRE